MRYQQKQKVELEQKRSELIGGRGLTAIDPNENGKALPALIGNGKVSGEVIAIGIICALYHSNDKCLTSRL